MKRTKVFGIVVALMIGSLNFLQAQDSAYVSNEYAKAVALYQRAQRYNDGVLQKQALMEMSILTPRDTAVLRSLAELYYNNSQFISSALVAGDINSIDPTSIVALEIQALSFENLRLYDKAVENYEKLWLQTDDSNVLYQVCYLQFSLKRYDEAINNLNILNSKISDDTNITLNKSDGTTQMVKMKAAMANLRGLIAKDQDQPDQAKQFFQNALALSPDFEAAKLSLEEMN
jgi:tetratricopeptide (TPR) repeat protein